MKPFLPIAAVTLVLLGCGRPFRADRSQTPVFIICIDTLRSDHLPAYGYRSGSTPAIDALRRDSILFANAFCQVPETLPSQATVMTGLLPQNHGVRDDVGYGLSPKTPTLATILRQHGWQTGAAVSAYALRKSTGIAQGFEFYDDEVETSSAISAFPEKRDGESTRRALEQWLEGSSSRVFGFLHLDEPHAPYLPPAPFAKNRTPYDGEISYADAIVGRFLEELQSRGLYDRALIVLLSDHGEGLGEHGEDEHGVFVYRDVLQVPLLIKLPYSERHGTTVTDPVALTDVMPTILTYLHIAAPKTDGHDLLASKLDPNRAIDSESWYPRLHFGWSELKSMIDAHSHFIDAPSPELYHWPSDPGELHNVVATDQRSAAALRAALPPGQSGGVALPDPKDHVGDLHQFELAREQFDRGDDAGCQQTLQALLTASPMFSDAYALLGESERRSGDLAGAIAALRMSMMRFPSDSHVALALADALWAAGRRREAREHARLAIKGDPALAHEMLATFAIRRGDLKDATSEAEAALQADPDFIPALQLAALIADRRHDRNREITLLDQIVAVSRDRGIPAPPGVQKKRGDVLLRLERVEDAEAALRAETAAYPQNREAWANLAAILAAEGRRSDAESALRTALQKNPDAKMRTMAIETARVFGDEAFVRELERR